MEQDEPAGFVLTRAAADEAEIITIGTRPFAQRRGVAQGPARSSVHGAFRAKASRMSSSKSRHPTRRRGRFTHSSGFTQAGLRKGYYERADGSREDAIVMRRDLAP